MQRLFSGAVLDCMKRTIRRYIKKISLKNLILPALILAAVTAAAFAIPFDAMLIPCRVNSVSELAAAVSSGEKYIEYDLEDLVYTGEDLYKGDEAAAGFYYLISEDSESCVFFLVSGGDEVNSGRARVVSRDEYVLSFLKNYSAKLLLSAGELEEISGGYIISSYDYHFWVYLALAALLCAMVLVCLVYILFNIIIFFAPLLHPSCRRLKRYGLSGRDFSDIDRELEEDRIIEAGNLFATSHYLVAFQKGTLSMIPLFNIVWAYHYVSGKFPFSRRLLSYTLVVYTSPAGKVIMRGNRKKDTDRILSFLDRDFSHIAVGYTEEEHRKIKEMHRRGEL